MSLNSPAAAIADLRSDITVLNVQGESSWHMAPVQNKWNIEDFSLNMRLLFEIINRLKFFKVRVL